ncbi:MAG: hypothetical protein HY077_12855 [Elusimicrobia bacterium]|nr:hypothetical protein [Elusimicrobiota bacterium]
MDRLSRLLASGLLAVNCLAAGPPAASAKMDCCGKSCPAPEPGAPRDCCQIAPAHAESALPSAAAPAAFAALTRSAPAPSPRPQVLPAPTFATLPGILCEGPCGLSPPTPVLG